MPSPAVQTEDVPIKRILIIQTAFTGDTIIATACVEKIRYAHPDVSIDILVRKGNESLFDHHPHIRNLFIWDKRNGKNRQLLSLIGKFRRHRYDWCINLQRHWSTALMTVFCGARYTAGFSTTLPARFYTRRVPHAIEPEAGLIHEVDLFLQVAGGIVPDARRTLPKLYPSPEDFAVTGASGPYITIAPASVWFTKQYPPEKWIEVINRIGPEYSVHLIGGKEDIPLCARIRERAQHPSVYNRAGTLSYLRSAALMRGAVMNYVNDSAPLHIASAVEAPVTAVFCSTVPAFGFGPLGTKARVVETDRTLACRPCGPHGFKQCPRGHFRCAEIDPERIMGKLPEQNLF